MTERHTVDSITSDALDQLYDRAEGAEAARDRLFRSRDIQAARAKTAKARVTELETEVARLTAGQQPAGPVLPGDLRTCCDARIGHYPGCPA